MNNLGLKDGGRVMAVVSYKLKVVADKEKKEKIFEAHKLFNKLVATFEEFLKLIRQKDYYYKDDDGEHYKSEEEVTQELKEYLEKNTNIENIEKVMQLLPRFENIIIEKGSQAAGQLTKLYNKESTGGTNNLEKIIDPLPEWVNHYNEKTDEFDEKKYKRMADDWISSEDGQKAIQPIMSGSGRASAFKKAYLENKPWYKGFVKDQTKYRKDATDGLGFLLFSLEKENAFPLLYLDKQLIEKYSVYVRLALKTALENFASYLACDEKTRTKYAEKRELFVEEEKKIKECYEKEYELINKYLQEQYDYTETDVYLTKRMTRGIEEIIGKFNNCTNEDERMNVLKNIQEDKQKKNKMGDFNLFHYLAFDANKEISLKAIQELLSYYQKKQQYDNARKCAAYTTADAINSKRYIMYENVTNNNFKNYRFYKQENRLFIKFPILRYDDNEYVEEELELQLADSKQLSGPLNDEGFKESQIEFDSTSKIRIRFANSKKIISDNRIVNEEFTGIPGGVDIVPIVDINNSIKDIFVSVPITLDKVFEDGQGEDNERIGKYFLKAYDGKIRKEANMFDNKRIRALSVDIGLKQVAACSVGSIIFDANKSLQDDIDVERSFLLALEGEKVSSKILRYRNDAMLELKKLKTSIDYLSFLKRLYNCQDTEKRNKLINNAIIHTNSAEKINVYRQCLMVNDDEVRTILSCQYDSTIKEMNLRMKEFRSGSYTKKGYKKYCGGKSYWSLCFLEEVRKIIMSWNSLSYRINEDNKLMSKQYGVSASNLLLHINRKKDDRIKTAADMIVQAARGYVYNENPNICNYKGGAWEKKYDECNVIVFPNLKRYTFSTDRPRQENSRLMKWSHAALIGEVKRQASVYGIYVVEIGTAFSTKFYHQNQAPGIRCDRLTKNDFNDYGVLKSSVASKIPEEYLKKKLKVGSLIPSDIGSIFVSLDSNGNLIRINSDINASLNLLKRYFLQQTMLGSIPTCVIDGKLSIKIDEKNPDINKLLKGGMLKRFGETKPKITQINNFDDEFKLVSKNSKKNEINVSDDKLSVFFNDESGTFFDSDKWITSSRFWEKVNRDINDALLDIL